MFEACKSMNKYLLLPSTGMVSPNSFRSFWISFSPGFVAVGRAGEDAFMKCRDPPGNDVYSAPKPIDVKYVGFSTGWGSTGEFRFCGLNFVGLKSSADSGIDYYNKF